MILLVYPQSVVEKNVFILPKEKNKHAQIKSRTHQLKRAPTQKITKSKSLNYYFSFTKPLKFSLRSSENISYKVGK